MQNHFILLSNSACQWFPAASFDRTHHRRQPPLQQSVWCCTAQSVCMQGKSPTTTTPHQAAQFSHHTGAFRSFVCAHYWNENMHVGVHGGKCLHFFVKIKNMKIQPKYLLNSNEKKFNDFFSVLPCYARSRLNVTLTCTHTNKHCVQWLRYGGHTGCLPAARVLILRGFAVCFLTMGMCVLSTW